MYSGYSSGSSQHSSSSPDSEESNPAPPPAAAGSQGSSGSPASQAYEQGGGSGGVIYSAWRKLDNGTYIRVNDSLRAQDLWYASSPSSVNSSTLDAMDVIEIENGRWVFSEEWAWKWEPKAGQVCFLHNSFQQFPNHFKAIFWMLQFIFFRVKQLLLEVGRCCRTGSGFSIRPPRRPTLRRARRVGNLEVIALGIIKCQ